MRNQSARSGVEARNDDLAPGDPMPASRTLARLFVIPCAMLLAACAASVSPTPSGSTGPTGSAAPMGSDHPIDSPAPSGLTGALILRVTTEGGFIGPAANLAAVPSVSVYADGRILTPGAVDAIYPGPLVPPVTIRDVGASGVQAIVAAIRAAGLDRASIGGPGISGDTGTTVFAVTLDGSTTTSRLALGGGAPGPGGPGGPGASADPATAAARDLLARLSDPSETWGAASAPQATLVPAGYLVYVAPGAPADQTVPQASVAWPLATPLAAFGAPAVPDRGIAGLRQGAVLGADVATLAPIVSRATSITPFTSGGSAFTLFVRPLLPDEVPA
jgi:hypothetical protein